MNPWNTNCNFLIQAKVIIVLQNYNTNEELFHVQGLPFTLLMTLYDDMPAA